MFKVRDVSYIDHLHEQQAAADDYFKRAAAGWSDAFEEHLHQDIAPLRIDATMTVELENVREEHKCPLSTQRALGRM